MARKDPGAPNSNYRPTTIPPPPGTAGPGTHLISIPTRAGSVPAVVHQGTVHVMKPEVLARIQQQKQTGHNAYGWEHKK